MRNKFHVLIPCTTKSACGKPSEKFAGNRSQVNCDECKKTEFYKMLIPHGIDRKTNKEKRK